ncbi:LysM peptidoglycan-binding domain-containing protein [Paenibacillus thiaminolyticus]|uniref:LysM peptidoglycan-binding domain-containing protein n=1 Tax=Paenibacillus thiaminolyticus TaxID=49283 RepID=UPI002280DE77|nr:LysM peptidoglycan-binding domain-containing protein [Paenibacillus thiaminolyticus]MCY9738380.1 LysM peptidoglycan-binding domain-containing protein [Paenibacillus thiaminolyticus]
MKIHIVKNGESLYSIAKKYDVPLEELIKMNPQLKDPNEIDVGMKIKVPSSSHPQTGHEIVHKHVVKEGDTLWKLSKAWGVPLQEMIEANPQLKNPNVLVIGQVVNIPKVSGMTPPSSDSMPMHHGKGEMTAPKSKEELTAPKPIVEIMPPKAELTKPKPEVTAPKPKVEITLPKYELEFEMEKVEYVKPEKPKHEYPLCPPAPTLPIPAPPILECPEPPAILPYMEEQPKPFYSCCPEPYAPIKEIPCGCGEHHHHHPFAQYPVPAAEVVAPAAMPPVYADCPPWQAFPIMQPPHVCDGGYPIMPYSHSSGQPVFVSPGAMADPAPAEWSPSMPGQHEMEHGTWNPHDGMMEHGKWHPHHGMGEHGKWHPHHGMGEHGTWEPHDGMMEHGKWHPHHGMGEHGKWEPHDGMMEHGKWHPHHGMGEHGKWHPHHGMGEHGTWDPHDGMMEHGKWHPHHGMGEHGTWDPHNGMAEHGEWHPHHGMGEHGTWDPHDGMAEHGEWYPHHGMGESGEWYPHHGMSEHGGWHPHGMTGHGEWLSHTGNVYQGMHQTYPTYISPEAGWHNPEPCWGMPHWQMDGWEKGKACDGSVHEREEELEAETANASSAENGESEERIGNSSDTEKKATIRSASGKKSPRNAQKAKASSRKQRPQGMPWIGG